MSKPYIPPADAVAIMLECWNHGSMGNAYPYLIGLHHARKKALESSGYVEWRPAPFSSTRLHLTESGERYLREGGHLPDPGLQWQQMRAVHACLVKIIALHNGWKLYPTPTLPHPWRYIVALECSSWNEDYRRLGIGRSFADAIQACEGIATGDTTKAWTGAIALRRTLEETMAKPLTTAHRDSYKYGCEALTSDEREALPAEPVQQATGT